MAELEREAVAALAALKAARTPPAGAAATAWTAMQQRLLQGPPPLPLVASADTSRTRSIAIIVALAAALVLAVGVAGWSAGWLAGTRAQQEQAGYGVVPPEPTSAPRPEQGEVVAPPAPRDDASTPPVITPGEPPAPASTPSGVVTPPEAGAVGAAADPDRRPRRRPRAAATPSEPTPPPETSTLEAEMTLLARASASRRAGDREAALVALQRHAREFPEGQLAPERELQRAMVLCELGRADEARAIARGFAQRFAASPLRSKAATICAQEDAP
ncbi:MAG: hypothetical protein K1X88_23605 [Nannocystaceae bacterium]|nr:hypothetical protein [Nannocystaceae bacterium]